MKIQKTISNGRSNSSSFKLHYKRQKDSSLFYENDLFKGLKPADLALLFEKMEVRNYSAGSLIFMPQDSSCENLYLLDSGRVEMYRLTANGKRLVTRNNLPGEVFGIRGLLGRNMQKNFAEAKEDSAIGVITRQQVFEHLQHRPELMLRILENVCSRLYLLEERLVEAVYNPVNVRLAYFLLTNSSDSGVIAKVTHEEIGNRIGAVRQTVTETLGLLKKQGLVTIQPGLIRVVDRRRLEEMVKGTEH
jgi:CRP-like cAMP-binding protein